MHSKDLPKHYDPKQTENKWYQFWLDKKFFHADVNTKKETFSLVIPPPNVTDVLHVGHALNNTLQDILIRWKRMQGYETEWLPGTDHAGIATQVILEKKLAKEGLSKEKPGREKFIQRFFHYQVFITRSNSFKPDIIPYPHGFVLFLNPLKLTPPNFEL